MSLIITATDFSDVAENAVNYACMMARSQNAQLLVMHSHMVPVVLEDVPLPTSLIIGMQHEVEMQMSNLLSKLRHAYPEIDIQGKITYGDFIDAINAYPSGNATPLVAVLGNNNTEDATAWPDSELTDALRKIKYAVLAIPPGTKYKPIRTVCLAYDNMPINNKEIAAQIAAVALHLKAELHVLNAQTDEDSRDGLPDFDPGLRKGLSHAHASYHMIFNVANIDEAIQEYVNHNQVDLLIMIGRHHSFPGNLFHKSHTKSAARHTAVPILVFHDGHN